MLSVSRYQEFGWFALVIGIIATFLRRRWLGQVALALGLAGLVLYSYEPAVVAALLGVLVLFRPRPDPPSDQPAPGGPPQSRSHRSAPARPGASTESRQHVGPAKQAPSRTPEEQRLQDAQTSAIGTTAIAQTRASSRELRPRRRTGWPGCLLASTNRNDISAGM